MVASLKRSTTYQLRRISVSLVYMVSMVSAGGWAAGGRTDGRCVCVCVGCFVLRSTVTVSLFVVSCISVMDATPGGWCTHLTMFGFLYFR